jgi:hypothetical protein
MRLGLDHIGQIAWHVADVDRAEASARGRLACAGSIASAISPSSEGAGVRLMIEKTQHPDNPEKSSVIYVGGAAIALAVGEHGKARLIAEAGRSRSLEGVLRRPRRPQAGAYASSAERMRRRRSEREEPCRELQPHQASTPDLSTAQCPPPPNRRSGAPLAPSAVVRHSGRET